MVKVERKHPQYVNRSGAGLDWKIQIHPLKEGVYVTSNIKGSHRRPTRIDFCTLSLQNKGGIGVKGNLQ